MVSSRAAALFLLTLALALPAGASAFVSMGGGGLVYVDLGHHRGPRRRRRP